MQIFTVTQIDWNYGGDDNAFVPWQDAFKTRTEAKAQIQKERYENHGDTDELEWSMVSPFRCYAYDEGNSLEWVICEAELK